MSFIAHHIQKKESDYWRIFGAHLGTTWDKDELERMCAEASSKHPAPINSRILVPLSLVMNPNLPAALLGRTPKGAGNGSHPASGHGLNTGIELPEGDIVNMAELSKEEFFGFLSSVRGANKSKK